MVFLFTEVARHRFIERLRLLYGLTDNAGMEKTKAAWLENVF